MRDEPNDEPALMQRLHALTGVTDTDTLQRIAHVVSSVLLEQLPAHDAAWFARELPPTWTPSPLPTHVALRPADALADFYERIAARAGEPLSFAREHAVSVCRALAQALDADVRKRLTSRLPDALGELFVLAEDPRFTPGPRAEPHARTTLSEARAGSRHPLSEAAPERAQRESIARTANPHADTKLSSSRGTTQEREEETLAEGRPGRSGA